jgi:glycerol-3-phosphate dehydrogenase
VSLRAALAGTASAPPTRTVINAAGPWIDQVWEDDSLGLPRMNDGTKGTHLVVDPFPGAPKDAFYYEAKSDGRAVLVLPWNGKYLIGATDIRFDGDLDMASATQDEYDYILAETNAIIPEANLTMGDVLYAYTGVRPLPFVDQSSDVSDITRRHDIRHHEDVADGLYTLVGGKLTTFRQVGEDFGDLLSKRFGIRRRSVTRKLTLPGGRDKNLARLRTRVAATGVDPSVVARLVDQYGTRAVDLAALITSTPERSEVLDAGFGLTVGEIEWAITHEGALRLSDVLSRRTMVQLQSGLGRDSIEPAAEVCARLLGWDEERKADEIARHERFLTRFVPPAA